MTVIVRISTVVSETSVNHYETLICIETQLTVIVRISTVVSETSVNHYETLLCIETQLTVIVHISTVVSETSVNHYETLICISIGVECLHFQNVANTTLHFEHRDGHEKSRNNHGIGTRILLQLQGLRDWSLIMGRGATKREGGGGIFFSHAEGGAQKVLG